MECTMHGTIFVAECPECEAYRREIEVDQLLRLDDDGGPVTSVEVEEETTVLIVTLPESPSVAPHFD
jgi:hypothetical protein